MTTTTLTPDLDLTMTADLITADNAEAVLDAVYAEGGTTRLGAWDITSPRPGFILGRLPDTELALYVDVASARTVSHSLSLVRLLDTAGLAADDPGTTVLDSSTAMGAELYGAVADMLNRATA